MSLVGGDVAALRANRLPYALLGELPIGASHRLVDLDTAADHADEGAHHDSHQKAWWTGLELASRLRSDDDMGEHFEHAVLEGLTFGVEVARMMMELEEHERLRILDGKLRHS